MDKKVLSREEALKKLSREFHRSFAADQPKDTLEIELEKIESLPNELLELLSDTAMLPKELKDELLTLKLGASKQQIEEFQIKLRKDKARRVQAAIRTKRKNKLSELEKEVRSDRNIPKLQKMIMIREIQRQRSNL